MSLRPICITADDYGLARCVNDGITSLSSDGALQAVSVMAHDGAVLSDVDALVQTGVRTGAHLVFVEERPRSRNPALAPLLTSDGRLPSSYRTLFAQLLARPRLADALVDEARAQLQALRDAGVPIHFVNSHQHVHLFPILWRAIGPLVVELGVPVRMVRPWRRGVRVLGARVRGVEKKQLALDVAGAASWVMGPRPHARVWRPIGVEHAGRFTVDGITRALAQIDTPPHDLAEIVVHPGDEDDALRAAYAHWGYRWAEEARVLRSDALSAALRAHGYSRQTPIEVVDSRRPA